MDLDKIDRKILYELLNNSRQHHKEIAKKVRMSPQALSYRINKLENNNILRSYSCAIDLTRLGFTLYKVYFKTQQMTEDLESAIIQDLINTPFISQVATCEAAWDFYFSITCINFYHFNAIWTQFYNKYSPYIVKKSFSVNKRILRFKQRYLTLDDYPSPLDYSIIEWAKGEEKISIDSLDTQLLLLLSHNTYLSTHEIASALHISRKTASSHLKKLIDNRIIIQFSALINLDAIGIQTYKILCKINHLDTTKKQQLITLLNKNPYVSHVMYCIGEWDLELYIETPTVESNRALIRQLRYDFSGLITDLEVIRFYKIHKMSYFSKEIKKILDTRNL